MEVTDEETGWASEIAAAYSGEATRSVSPIVGEGSVNKIFVCRTAHGGEYVVRMSSVADEWRGVAFFEKERWCIAQAEERGVPGPRVLEIGRRGTRPYMLQTLVPGTNGETAAGKKQQVWEALGRHAKIIHSINLDGFGETLGEFHTGDAVGKWHGFVAYNLRSLTPNDALIGLQVYAPEHRDRIRHCFERLLAVPFRFGLNHGDLSPRNTRVDDSGMVYLLDWGSAEAHIVPHYDFLHVVPREEGQNPNFLAFLQGYGMSNTSFAEILPSLRDLLLLKAFDLTRWAIDRCPERTESLAARARQARQIALS